MKLLVIILFTVITVLGSVFAFTTDDKSRDSAKCPYLKSKQQTECPFIKKQLNSDKQSNNQESKVDGCPFLNNQQQQQDVCPYSGKSKNNTIDENSFSQKWMEIRS